MKSRIVEWLGKTPRERAIAVAAPLVMIGLVVGFGGGDDLLPFLLLWLGFTVTLVGVHRLFPVDGAASTRWAVLVVALGAVTAAAGLRLDGDGSWGVFALLGFLVVAIAGRRRAAVARGV